MVEKMFFLDNEHIGIGEMLPPKKLFVCSCYACFLKIILQVMDFFVAAIIRYVAKFYK